MSLYGEYVKERLGDSIIEDYLGFATYRFINDGKTVYIVDIYVKPEARKGHHAKDMADAIVFEAKGLGVTEMIGTVSPQALNATESIKVLLAYGMKFHSCNEQALIFRKDIGVGTA